MEKQEDVFEMSQEDFDTAISEAKENDIETEDAKDTEVIEDESTESTESDINEVLFSEEDKKPEQEAFDFRDTDFSSKEKEEQRFKIVHNGQEHFVTQDELVNLAQKGYDYNQKTSKIAPHRRLIELIEEDEELRDKINQHVVGKYVPDVSNRDDYETEEEWLKDNLSRTVSKVSPFIEESSEESKGTQQSDPTGQNPFTKAKEPEIVTLLRNRDPQNFDTVIPYMKGAITNLSVKQYQDISNSPQKVFQFYDLVKTKLSEAMQNQNPGHSSGQKKVKSFNLRSGQGTNTRPNPKEKNVWEMSNRDFNALRQRSLGY